MYGESCELYFIYKSISSGLESDNIDKLQSKFNDVKKSKTSFIHFGKNFYFLRLIFANNNNNNKI